MLYGKVSGKITDLDFLQILDGELAKNSLLHYNSFPLSALHYPVLVLLVVWGHG